MPSLNQGKYIRIALQSVLSQSWKRLEIIVADGGSTDGTMDVLAELQHRDVRLRWFSEHDKGPVDALNKALAQCRGTIIGWLNSDDVYTPGALSRAMAALDANPHWLMVYGDGEHVDEQGRFINRYPTRPPSASIDAFANGCFICQPTVFFRRSMYIMLGRLDATLRSAFDFDYWLRAFSAFPARIGFVNAVQAQSRLHDACITRTMRRTGTVEAIRVLAAHLEYAPRHWVLNYAREVIASESEHRDMNTLKAHLNAVVADVQNCVRDTELFLLHRELADMFSVKHQMADSPHKAADSGC